MNTPITLTPDDDHNRTLVDQVHPSGWKNPQARSVYDMVVIGAGSAGLITALGAAGLGKKVALIERHLMGGDCLNTGCVPSKALIRAARAAHQARHTDAFGIEVPAEGIQVDFTVAMERMRRIRADISHHDSAQRFTDMGIDVFLGDAAFASRDSLTVAGQTLHFRKACIASGARAAAPPISGLTETGYLTNETVFSLTELPKRLAIIGAGPIGCEMAQSFARFGSQVSLIDSAHGVLPREDPVATEIIRKALTADGIKTLCCGRDLQIDVTEAGKRLRVMSHDMSYEILVDEILVAAGRTPNIEGLNLEIAGVSHDARGVQVDDHLRTTNPNIFAAGDICAKHQFTHAADAMARIVVRNALLGFLPFKPRVSKLVMPWCTYTDPEIAHVGALPQDLEADHLSFETIEIPMGGNDRSQLDGETDGLLRVHIKPNGTILGATLVASHAGDMISTLTTAMAHRIKLHQMARVIFPYPTQAEIIKRSADQAFKNRLLRMHHRVMSLIGRSR